MAKRLMIVLAVSIAAGLLVAMAWGTYPGVGVFAAAALIGAVYVVLRRNQQDLHDLERGIVPPEVDDALGQPPPPGARSDDSALAQRPADEP